VVSVLLQLALDDGGWLGEYGGADAAGGDLLQEVHRLHGRLRAAGAHRGGHGVGHWLDALR